MEEDPLPSAGKVKERSAKQSAFDLPLWESIEEKDSGASTISKDQAGSGQLPRSDASRGADVPELPTIQPSVLPPSSCSTSSISIPSILPKLYSKSVSDDSNDTASANNQDGSSGLGKDAASVPSEGERNKGKHKSSRGSVSPDAAAGQKSPEGEGAGNHDVVPVSPPPKPRPRGRPKSKGKVGRPSGSPSKKATPTSHESTVDKPSEVQSSAGEERGSGAGSRRASSDGGRERGGEEAGVESEPANSAGQRSTSVFVSVLAGPEKKPQKREKLGEERRSSSDDPGATAAADDACTSRDADSIKESEAIRRLSMTESVTPPMPYPHPSPSSFSYFPPPHPSMMYPGPGAGYPPYYGPYPTATMPYISGPMGGMIPAPPPPGVMEPSTDALPASFCLPPTSSGIPVTTVSGVRVSVLDKPPTHLPTVPAHQLPHPRPAPGPGYDQNLAPPPGTAGECYHLPHVCVGIIMLLCYCAFYFSIWRLLLGT